MKLVEGNSSFLPKYDLRVVLSGIVFSAGAKEIFDRKFEMETVSDQKEGSGSGSAGVQVLPASVWRLTWECYKALVLALVVGVLVAIPAIHFSVTKRFRSYAEVVYEVGNSPSAESRVVDWARKSPGVENFRCERKGGDLWVRWEDVYNMPAVFLFGLVLAWAFHRTGSLVTSGVAHALNNGLAIATMVMR